MRVKTGITGAAVALLCLSTVPQAHGDPIPIVPSVPGGGLGGLPVFGEFGLPPFGRGGGNGHGSLLT